LKPVPEKPQETASEQKEVHAPVLEIPEDLPTPEKIEVLLNAWKHLDIETSQANSVIANLAQLKMLIQAPKEDAPELRFSKIKQYLGEPECHETVRRERWRIQIECPKCKSINLKRITQLSSKTPLNHRYRCLECDTIFNDDSDTPFESEVPSLNIWMQCWYLMGCTESHRYIANKLNLDITTVEWMIQRLQKTFGTKQPLLEPLGASQWNKQAQHLLAQLKNDLKREYDDSDQEPQDTSEHRKKINRRRQLRSSTEPRSPGGTQQ